MSIELLTSVDIAAEQARFLVESRAFQYPNTFDEVVLKNSDPMTNNRAGERSVTDGFDLGERAPIAEKDGTLVTFLRSLGVKKFDVADCPPACVSYHTPGVEGIEKDFTSGGSSGGSAAEARNFMKENSRLKKLGKTLINFIVGNGDGGGSTRFPAAANCIVGIKPDMGELPNDINEDTWDGSAVHSVYAPLDVIGETFNKFRSFFWEDYMMWAFPERKGNKDTDYRSSLLEPPKAKKILYVNGIWNRSDYVDESEGRDQALIDQDREDVVYNSEALKASMDRMQKLGHFVTDRSAELLFSKDEILGGVFGYLMQVSIDTKRGLEAAVEAGRIKFSDFDNACRTVYALGSIFDNDAAYEKFRAQRDKLVSSYAEKTVDYDFVAAPTIRYGVPRTRHFESTGEIADMLWTAKDDAERSKQIKELIESSDDFKMLLIGGIHDLAIANITRMASASIPISEVKTPFGDEDHSYNPSLSFHATKFGETPTLIGLARQHGHQ